MKTADESRIAPKPIRGSRIALYVVLGLLTAVVVLAATVPYIECPSKAEVTQYSIGTIETGLKLYRSRHGAYPNTAEGLRILVQERIFNRMPRDGWGNEVAFLSDGTRYEITSYGADGAPGGAGNDGDIRSSGP